MLLIFTDLDGTLLNQDDYDYSPALPALARLVDRQIPVIPVTSKTRAEVEVLRQALGLIDPFVVENGSGVFLAQQDPRFVVESSDRPPAELWGNYHLFRLGCTYPEARRGLQQVAEALGESLRGFGDLSAVELEHLTGLPLADVTRAQTRDFTEPFVTPLTQSSAQIEAAVEAAGFRVVVGDRFSHLIGTNAGKGNAVRLLVQLYQAAHPQQTVTTIGLGNSPNDLGLLEAVDLPIVVPGPQGPHPALANRGWQIASAPGASGWAAAVEEMNQHLLS